VRGVGLKLTGALFYAAKLYGLVVGAAFILLITRNLAPEEYGAWSVISSLLAYATAGTVVNYWVTRFRAYGDASATSTGLALAAAFSLAASAAFAALAGSLPGLFGIPLAAAWLALPYIPVLYANSALYAAVYAVKPRAAALSEFAFKTAKLAAALVFALGGRVTLREAMLAVLAGYAAQLASLAVAAGGEALRRPSAGTAGRMLSYSWLSAMSLLASLIGTADVLIISRLSSNEAVAYYTVVLAYSNAIAYSYLLARGLYQRLLSAGNRPELVEESLRAVLLLAIPSTAGAVALAPNLLYLLNPLYARGADVLRAAALTAMLGTVNGVLLDAVQGAERVDAAAVSHRELVKSKLFKVVALSYAKDAVALPGIALSIALARDPVSVAAGARLSRLAAELLATAVLAGWAKSLGVRAPAKEALEFAIAALAASLPALLINPLRIREALLTLLAAALTYFATLYLLSRWFRLQVSQALKLLAKASEKGETSRFCISPFSFR
jgi:hypothetical protein